MTNARWFSLVAVVAVVVVSVAATTQAGPYGYLRSAKIRPVADTFDLYSSPRGGAIQRDARHYVVRAGRRTADGRYEMSDAWYDSTGKLTALQSVRTGKGTIATEIETVRANTDSASMLVVGDHVTAWVVPAGQPMRLFDGATAGERYTTEMVASAIALTKPAIGAEFLAPISVLYGPNPLLTSVDTIRVLRRDELSRGNSRIPVLVLERSGGTQTWMDEATGSEVLSRGNAGPTRWWWHVRRGVTPPVSPK
ncbi:MAG: hypothetical protein ACHQQR_16365 [Gemmatimonadales bacterium]